MKGKFQRGAGTTLFAWISVIASIVTLMVTGQAAGRILERHLYRQTSGKDSFQYTWERENLSPVKIRIVEPNDTFITQCDAAGETEEWIFLNQQTWITAKRSGESIHITGTFQGRSFEEKIETKGERWYQALSYALRQMAQSDIDEETFWMIRPDTLEPLKIKVFHLEPEIIEVSGKAVPAFKLRISLTGLLENLWSAHYWFRLSDGVFLQYKGANGPPGTPETLIQLLD